MTAKTAPSKGGRPRVYRKVANLSLRGEASVLEELKAYARWRAYREGKAISLVRAIFDAVHESPTFRAFQKERSK